MTTRYVVGCNVTSLHLITKQQCISRESLAPDIPTLPLSHSQPAHISSCAARTSLLDVRPPSSSCRSALHNHRTRTPRDALADDPDDNNNDKLVTVADVCDSPDTRDSIPSTNMHSTRRWPRSVLVPRHDRADPTQTCDCGSCRSMRESVTCLWVCCS